MNISNFIDLDLSGLEIPNEEKGFWNECKVWNGTVIITKTFTNMNDLSSEWKNSVHFTAGYIQRNIESLRLPKSSALDIYLVFFCKEIISDQIRLKIEQDKFCCKKYVFSIGDNQDPWEIINNRLPLLFKWVENDSEVFYSAGNDAKHVRNRLTEGINTPLSRILHNEHNFNQLSASNIVTSLLDQSEPTNQRK